MWVPRSALVCWGAEEFPEEEAAGRQDATVSVDQATFHGEGHVAERLPAEEQVQVVERETVVLDLAGAHDDEEETRVLMNIFI